MGAGRAAVGKEQAWMGREQATEEGAGRDEP